DVTQKSNPQAMEVTHPRGVRHHEIVTPAPQDLLQSLASFDTLQALPDTQSGSSSEALLDLLSQAAPRLPSQEEDALPLRPSRSYFQPWILILTCLLIVAGAYSLWSLLTR